MSEMTPGRAAYEAYEAVSAPPDEPASWDVESSENRDAWEAAAQAAIEAFAQQPSPLIVSISSKLTEADVARLREKFAEAVRTGRPRQYRERTTP